MDRKFTRTGARGVTRHRSRVSSHCRTSHASRDSGQDGPGSGVITGYGALYSVPRSIDQTVVVGSWGANEPEAYEVSPKGGHLWGEWRMTATATLHIFSVLKIKITAMKLSVNALALCISSIRNKFILL